MENKGAIQKSFGCVFWLLLVMSLIPAGVGGYSSWQEYQSLGWSKVPAKIVEGGYFHPKGNDSGDITVEYVLDGKTYRHPVAYTFGQSSVLTNDLTIMRKYSFSAVVDIYYDPLEPPIRSEVGSQYYQRQQVVFKHGMSDDFYVPFIFSAVFFFGAFGFRKLARGTLSGIDTLQQKVSEMPTHQKERISAKEVTYDEDIEKLVEDKKGRVILDNTGRVLRMITAIFFLLILASAYWGLIFWAEANPGELQWYFSIPMVWALVVAFSVSDSTLIKREGILQTRRGWLFFIKKKTYLLHHFNKITVTTLRSRRHRTDDHRTAKVRYDIKLEGKDKVSIFIAGHYDDACKLAQQIAQHLKISVEY